MSYPETTREQAEALLKSSDFNPVRAEVDGKEYRLSARVVEDEVMSVTDGTDGYVSYVVTPALKVSFLGGKWGEVSLSCDTSTVARIRAHWEGFKQAHFQANERAAALALRSAPSPKPQGWKPQVGDKCFFPRGMYGKWRGTIRSMRLSRGSAYADKGEVVVDISFTGRNGKRYVYDGVPLKELTQNGKHAA